MKFFFSLSFILAIILSVKSQDVPVIYAKNISSLQYSTQDIEEWERYIKICGEYTEPFCGHSWGEQSSNSKLSDNDKKFIQYFESKFICDFENFDTEMAPWEVEVPGCSWYCGASYEIKTSSHLTNNKNNIYSQESIWDNNTRTAWIEGAKGYGIGEYIEFIFPLYAPRATTAFIANGYNKNELTWKNNSRIKTFSIYDDDTLIGIVHLKDTRNLQSFELPYPFPNRLNNNDGSYTTYDDEGNISNPKRLKFVITDIYKGDKYEDTAISEFFFDGMDVHCIAEGSLIEMADGSKTKIEEIILGDNLLTYNYKENRVEANKVTKIIPVTHTNLVKITFKTPTGISKIIATEDHPFYTEKGWKSFNPKKTKLYKRYMNTQIEKYKKGDYFKYYSPEGFLSIPIENIEFLDNPTKTYTIEIEGENAFIVNGLIAGQE